MVDAVVRNLLINAIKFTPADGEILAITAVQTAHDVCVTVADTGIGISPNKKIAQLFRIDEEDTTRWHKRRRGRIRSDSL